MKELVLTKGYIAIVDDEDYDALSKFKWTAMVHKGKTQTRVYAYRRTNWDNVAKRQRGMVFLHRAIMNAPTGLDVDHINHDTLDNRRSNLRLATRSQNLANNRREIGRSGYRGVAIDLRDNRAYAQISNKVIGSFKDCLQAALEYDRAAFLKFGEFAKMNFPFRKL